jgi:hypothetical protein
MMLAILEQVEGHRRLRRAYSIRNRKVIYVLRYSGHIV